MRVDLIPYALVKLVTGQLPALASRLASNDWAALEAKWTIAKVAGLDTPAIVTRLAGLGLDGSRPAFLALTAGRTSAWSIGAGWLDGLPRRPPADDRDFVCLAACELWKRYGPERPSIEMVDDWVTAGYAAVEAQQEGAAVDLWQQAWDAVRPRLPAGVRTFASADGVLKLSPFFGTWIEDFIMAGANAARDNPAHAEVGIRVAREVLERFVDEEANTLLNCRCDLGRLLFLAHRSAEAEATLQAVIREHPTCAGGYVTLADELSSPTRGQPDYARAIALLEQAQARPVEDAADWDVVARLRQLRLDAARGGAVMPVNRNVAGPSARARSTGKAD